MRLFTALMLSMFCCSAASAWFNSELESAYHRQDVDALTEMASTPSGFEQQYAQYRLAMVLLSQGNKKAAKKTLDPLLDTLEELERTPDQQALYAGALGLSIGLRPWTAGGASKRSAEALSAALAAEPEHAASLMIDGIGLFNAPGLFGGDKDKARERFAKASALYQRQSNPSWGYREIELWRARALFQNEQTEKAKQVLEALLAAEPNFIDAQSLLNEMP